MLPNWYTDYKNLIDNSINNYLIDYFKSEENKWLDIIKEATLYATKWWKRIRSIMALEFYMIFSWKKIQEIKQNDNIINFCLALELLHAYSLVHDDLPSMDNDALRRWEATVWKKFWEADAVLVWDLLNSLSFEILSQIWNISLIKYFWKAVWLKWMLWWQVLDIFYEENPDNLTLENLKEVHDKKTWALIEISIVWAIILTSPQQFPQEEQQSSPQPHPRALSLEQTQFTLSPQGEGVATKNLDIYKDFWEKIGLAFQVKDDLLDVEWTFEETGKSVWWEEKGFVYFLWLDKTKQYLDNLINNCFKITKELNSEKLEFLIKYIWNRKK